MLLCSSTLILHRKFHKLNNKQLKSVSYKGIIVLHSVICTCRKTREVLWPSILEPCWTLQHSHHQRYNIYVVLNVVLIVIDASVLENNSEMFCKWRLDEIVPVISPDGCFFHPTSVYKSGILLI